MTARRPLGPLAGLAVALALLLLAPQMPVAQLLERSDGGDIPITVEADQGIEWIRDAKAYVARGNAKAIRGDTVVAADTLTASYRDKAGGGTEVYRLEANGNVVITTPQERAVADRAIYDLDQSVVVLLGEGLEFRTLTDVITARDSLEYWEANKVAVARGDAQAVRENQRIRADSLTAYFQEQAPGAGISISRVDAVGDVVITTPQEVARGREGVYNARTGTATLNGDVRITRGENQLNGERAEVNLNTGISRLLPAGQGGERVRGLFTPGTAPR
jgi:lipopolysaccharide export system protein LptA